MRKIIEFFGSIIAIVAIVVKPSNFYKFVKNDPGFGEDEVLNDFSTIGQFDTIIVYHVPFRNRITEGELKFTSHFQELNELCEIPGRYKGYVQLLFYYNKKEVGKMTSIASWQKIEELYQEILKKQ